jgi:hypothetical protein
MKQLSDFTVICRSKNSGPFVLVLDAVFKDEDSYEYVRNAGVINQEEIARRYNVPVESVRITEFKLGNAIKVAIPRLVSSGDASDTDVYGAQQHVPFMTIDVP